MIASSNTGLATITSPRIFACLMFMIIFITSTILTNAQSDEAEFEYKYYKTVMVHADDTLWDIASANYSAEHYSDMNGYINEICKY